MAAPQSGRVFLKTHQDCFIHGMAYLIQYWNFSLNQEGVGIVKVTFVKPDKEEKIFLSCLCPMPLEYANVHRGIPHRKYLEMDPKFAEGLGIGQDTEVVLESVREIEKCLKLKLAPKDPKDFEILCNNSEKITFELAERIRVVSCQNFFSFPIWINSTVIRVQVVSSEPSANWVLINPNTTIVELCLGADSGVENTTSATTNTSITRSSPISSDSDDESGSSKKQNSYTTYYPNNRPASITSTGHSGESSVDQEMVTNAHDWKIGKFLKKIFYPQNMSQNAPWASWITNDQDAEVAEVEEVQPVINKEPFKSSEKYGRLPSSSEEEVAKSNKVRLHSELRSKFSDDNLDVRQTTVTPEPRPSRSTGLIEDEPLRPAHKRNLTYSEGDFGTRKSPMKLQPPRPGRPNRLSPYVNTPKMDANVRVQPHAISGHRRSYEKIDMRETENLWCLENVFDVFVHPSTLPEVFHYFETSSAGEAFLVELLPVPLPDKGVTKNQETAGKMDSISDLSERGSTTSSVAKINSGLPSSVVVRLCFATSVVVKDDCMFGTMQDAGIRGSKFSDPSVMLEVGVKVGQVVMSDLLRRQLEVKECSRVRLLYVLDKWRLSSVDTIGVVIHPVSPATVHREDLKKSFKEWIRHVSSVSKFGCVVVHRQVVPLTVDDTRVILCWLSVSSRQLLPRQGTRTSYALITPMEFAKSRVNLMADGFGARHLRHNSSRGKGSTEEVKLTDMYLLNQPPIKELPEDYGAIDGLLHEAFNQLRTVFTGRRRYGSLLLCGQSGTSGSGCGKTSILKLIARKAMSPPYYAFVTLLDCTTLRSQTTQRTKKRLSHLLDEAAQNQPSVVLLDNLDRSMPMVDDAQERVQEEGVNSINKTLVLRDLLGAARRRGAQIFVVASAQNKQQLNKDLLSSQGRQTFDSFLEIQPPSLSDREEIIKALLKRKRIPFSTEDELKEVALKTEGYQSGDLVTVMDRAVSHSELRILIPDTFDPVEEPSFCREMSIDSSASDLDGSLEVSSIPPLSFPSLDSVLEASTPQAHQERGDSGIGGSGQSNVFHIHRGKKISTVSLASASSFTTINTPSTPRSATRRFPVSTPQLRNPIYKAGSLSERFLTLEDFEIALRDFVPMSLRGLLLHTSGSVDFSHVGGMASVKKTLTETLQWPIKYPELFQQCPIKQRCGVLLYGAPGTGKTLLAGAVAREFNLNFVSVKGPELLSKYIGASEKAVRDIFNRAQSARPCVLFFDEFESLAPKRGHDNTGVTDRVVNQLLTQLDGVEVLEGVYILAASSRPDLIDPALLRPGRIDMKICCDIPDAEERYEIMVALCEDVSVGLDVDLKELARPSYTDNFTGADLKALLFNAQLKLAHEMLDQKRSRRDSLSFSATPPHSLESSPEMAVKAGACMGATTFSYESVTGVRKHSVLPEDVAEKIQVPFLLGMEQRNQRLAKKNSSKDNRSSWARKDRVVLTQEALILALKDSRPSVSQKERIKYSKIYEKFTGKAESIAVQDIKQMVTLA